MFGIFLFRLWPVLLAVLFVGFVLGQTFEHQTFCRPQPATFQTGAPR